MNTKPPRRWMRVIRNIFILLLLLLPIVIYLALGRAPACNFPATGPVEPGLSVRTMESGGRERCYTLYIPPQYDPTQPLPLVLSLHGFAGNASGLRDMTGWEAVAEAENFLVVYPEGSSFPLRWNISPAANIEEIDDVQFIHDLLAELATLVAIPGPHFCHRLL